MSKEEFKAFSGEVSQDENLQETVKPIINPSELIKVGREKGFNFTVEDISEGLTDLNKSKKSWDDLWATTSALPGSDLPKRLRIPPEMDGLRYFSEEIMNLAIRLIV